MPASLTRRLLGLAWPSVVEQIQRTLLGLLDVFVVGQLGAVALTAVGLGGQIQQMVLVVHSVFSLGAVILVARAMGAGTPATASLFVGQALLSAFVYSLAASVFVLGLAGPLLTRLGATGEILTAGTQWLHYVSFSFPFAGMTLVGSAALRGAGNTRTPLGVAMAASVVNVALAWTLTRGLFGAPRMGLAGHGLAGLIANVFGGLLMLWILRRNPNGLPWSVWRPRRDLLARVWKVGVPSGVEQVLVQLAFTTMAAMLARLGAAAYAANQITNWLAALAYLPGWGIAVAVVTLVGQELGARRLHEVKRSVRLGLVLAVLTNTALGVLLVLFSGWLLPIFNSDPEVLASGLGAMKLAALIQPIMAAAFIYTSALTGAGETQRVMLIGVCSAWLVRLTIAYLAGSVLGLGLAGFWIAIGADYACRAILAYASFRLGTWQTARPF